MVKLSKRMEAVAALVTSDGVLADVGTDHGYVAIALVQRGMRRAIAMDINRGPLERARQNIAAHGLQDRIETRLSDGVRELSCGEADSVLIAGMGGELILHILTEGEAVCRQAGELILQPQSDIRKVREYLRRNRYRIAAEDMVCEDGKFYPMLRAENAAGNGQQEQGSEPDGDMAAVRDIYGPLLLESGNPVLRSYLLRQREQLVQLADRLGAQPYTEAIGGRLRQVQEELACCDTAYRMLEAGIGQQGKLSQCLEHMENVVTREYNWRDGE